MKHIGFGPLKRQNQDEYFVQVGGYAGLSNGCLYCIFDGHGTYGGDVASFCQRELPPLLQKEMQSYYEVGGGGARTCVRVCVCVTL